MDWMQKVLSKTGEDSKRGVDAYMVLAMAQPQLQKPDEARAALAKGIEKEAELAKLESGAISAGWVA
jgi:hypothetical protein